MTEQEQPQPPQPTAEQQVAAYIFETLNNPERCTVPGDKTEMHTEAKRFMAGIAQGQLLIAPPAAPTPPGKPPGRKGPVARGRAPRKGKG